MTQVVETRLSTLEGGPARTAPSRASTRLWGVEWPEWSLGNLACVPVDFGEAVPFMAEHQQSFFADYDDRFFREAMSESKRRFLDDSDVWLVRDGERDVGVWIANPTDWASYYIRFTALLPAYRDQRIYHEFIHNLCGVLGAAGVDRVDAETSPTNLPVHRALLALGLIVTGTSNSDRWGTMLRYTKFLNAEANACFLRQFVITPNMQPKSASPSLETVRKGVSQ